MVPSVSMKPSHIYDVMHKYDVIDTSHDLININETIGTQFFDYELCLS